MNSSRSTVGYYEGVRGTYAALFFFYFFDWNVELVLCNWYLV
jgi:hypothetical protein